MSDTDAGLKQRVFGVCLLLVLSVFCLYLSFATVVNIAEIQNAKASAVTTTGTVTATNVSTGYYYIDDDGDDIEERHREYDPTVEYEYTVDGVRYESTEFYDDYDHTDSYTEPREARAVLPERGNVTVHYMPGNPDRSFLVEPSVNWDGAAWVGLAIGLIGVFSTVGLVLRLRPVSRAVLRRVR